MADTTKKAAAKRTTAKATTKAADKPQGRVATRKTTTARKSAVAKKAERIEATGEGLSPAAKKYLGLPAGGIQTDAGGRPKTDAGGRPLIKDA